MCQDGSREPAGPGAGPPRFYARGDRACTKLQRQNRGIVWSKREDYDRAVADFSQAIRLGTIDPFVYGDRALAWRRKGDYEPGAGGLGPGDPARSRQRFPADQPQQRLAEEGRLRPGDRRVPRGDPLGANEAVAHTNRWDRIYAVNVRAVFFLRGPPRGRCAAARGGSIVNVSSIAGQHGRMAGNPAYGSPRQPSSGSRGPWHAVWLPSACGPTASAREYCTNGTPPLAASDPLQRNHECCNVTIQAVTSAYTASAPPQQGGARVAARLRL